MGVPLTLSHTPWGFFWLTMNSSRLLTTSPRRARIIGIFSSGYGVTMSGRRQPKAEFHSPHRNVGEVHPGQSPRGCVAQQASPLEVHEDDAVGETVDHVAKLDRRGARPGLVPPAHGEVAALGRTLITCVRRRPRKTRSQRRTALN